MSAGTMRQASERFLMIIADLSETMVLNGCLEDLENRLDKYIFQQQRFKGFRFALYTYQADQRDPNQKVIVRRDDSFRGDFISGKRDLLQILREPTKYEGPACLSEGIALSLGKRNTFKQISYRIPELTLVEVSNVAKKLPPESILKVMFVVYPYEYQFIRGRERITRALTQLRSSLERVKLEIILVNMHPDSKDYLGLADLLCATTSDLAINGEICEIARATVQGPQGLKIRASQLESRIINLERRTDDLIATGRGKDEDLRLAVDDYVALDADFKQINDGLDKAEEKLGLFLENVRTIKDETDLGTTIAERNLLSQVDVCRMLMFDIFDEKSRMLDRYMRLSRVSNNIALIRLTLAQPLGPRAIEDVKRAIIQLGRI
eukprot:TRINITY_DN6881_c0_g1_i1.p1 TRINITY_DN6881_c0_g1~~TRINITY_DN6881_c0_g1_i1.p1  ORF type:complete len:379 (-),score=61.46 TRINITY_DN6881_c0_g1_i1:192-1328(-)